jgi:hypothetical protein
MILLEVRTAIRRASKSDLFTGDVNNMNAQQEVRDNLTVFYLDYQTNKISGPHLLYSYSWFLEVYRRMAYGKCGIITAIPNIVTNEILFDLVLREASIDDVKDTPRHIKKNRIYYTYSDKNLLGPFYIDNSTTSLYLENLIAKKQIFVPNERQHFKIRSLQKAS